MENIDFSPSKPQTTSHNLQTAIQTFYKQNLNSFIKLIKFIKENFMIKTSSLQKSKQYLAIS
jgi:hypothetical protein